jgi:hypothetical protein
MSAVREAPQRRGGQVAEEGERGEKGRVMPHEETTDARPPQAQVLTASGSTGARTASFSTNAQMARVLLALKPLLLRCAPSAGKGRLSVYHDGAPEVGTNSAARVVPTRPRQAAIQPPQRHRRWLRPASRSPTKATPAAAQAMRSHSGLEPPPAVLA